MLPEIESLVRYVWTLTPLTIAGVALALPHLPPTLARRGSDVQLWRRGVPVIVAGKATWTLKRLLQSWTLVQRFERAPGVVFLLAAVCFTHQALICASLPAAISP